MPQRLRMAPPLPPQEGPSVLDGPIERLIRSILTSQQKPEPADLINPMGIAIGPLTRTVSRLAKGAASPTQVLFDDLAKTAMYHGAGDANIGVKDLKHGFEIYPVGQNAGLFFTPNKNYAASYAAQNGLYDGNGLLRARTNFKNPLVTSNPSDIYYLTKDRMQNLQHRGYDGIVLLHPQTGVIDEVAAFSGDQLTPLRRTLPRKR